MKRFDHDFVTVEGGINSIETPEGRRYTTPEGIFPSVTTVTGYKKREFFAKWRRENPDESRRVLSRGTRLHSIIEDYLSNTLTNTTLAESAGLAEVDLFIQMQEDIDRIGKVWAIEVPLWSSKVGLAGRTDCIGEFDGVPSVIDFKSSTNPRSQSYVEDYFLQATAYALMWEDRVGIPLQNLAIIIGVESTGTAQVFTAHPRDYVQKLVEAIRHYRSCESAVCSPK